MARVRFIADENFKAAIVRGLASAAVDLNSSESESCSSGLEQPTFEHERLTSERE